MSFKPFCFFNTKIVILNCSSHSINCIPSPLTLFPFPFPSPPDYVILSLCFFNTKNVIFNYSGHSINSRNLPSPYPTSLFLYYFLYLLKECNDVSTTMMVFISLPNFISLCVLLVFWNTGAYGKTQFFVKMSLLCMGTIVFPLKSWFLLLGINLKGVKDS